MSRLALQFAEVRTARLGWRAVAWMVLVAFFLQSYVTQTHIHGLVQEAGSGIATVHASSLTRSTAPLPGDTNVCPFCQAVVHAGACFVPAASALLPPFALLQRVAAWASNVFPGGPASHPWQSRAPPHH